MAAFETSVPNTRRLAAPAPQAELCRKLRSSWQVAQAIVVFALLGWVTVRGAQSMNYHWQWYRVPPFFYRVVDGELIWGPLARGFVTTLQITSISLALSLVIGCITAALRLSSLISGRIIATCYLELIRNTPLLVQLFLFYFVLGPIFGVNRFWTAILTLSFYEGSFASEIIRGGILSIDRGQSEAADAIGLTGRDKYRYVIIPQSLPIILPPLTSLAISLVKSSAIVSVIAVSELTTEALNLISDTFMAFEIWLTVAGVYLILTVSLSLAVGYFESRLKSQR